MKETYQIHTSWIIEYGLVIFGGFMMVLILYINTKENIKNKCRIPIRAIYFNKTSKTRVYLDIVFETIIFFIIASLAPAVIAYKSHFIDGLIVGVVISTPVYIIAIRNGMKETLERIEKQELED